MNNILEFASEEDREEFINEFRHQADMIKDLQEKLALTERAFDLMSLVLCTGARDDLKRQLGKFTFRYQVKDFFLKEAGKEMSNGTIEFEYVNGKFIHNYALGGEHELTPQEVVDCLNALLTIDCDLQTAYAYIKGKEEKIADLQHRLMVAEKALELCERHHIGFKDATLEEQVSWRETRIKENIDYFKQQAKKELKGE